MKDEEKIKFIFEVKYPKDTIESDINTLMYRFRDFIIFNDRMSKGDSLIIPEYECYNSNIDRIINMLKKFKIEVIKENGRSNN